jgi:ankyrin repeat protein
MSAWRKELAEAVTSQDAGAIARVIAQGAAAKLLDETDGKGATALQSAVAVENLALATLLIEAGANVNAFTQWTPSPIHIAATNDSRAMLKLLVTSGALLDVPDKKGWTAMHLVAASNKHDIMAMFQLLVDAGASVSVRDRDGFTPLHQAAMVGSSMEIIRSLAALGAPLNTTNVAGETPLHSAVDEEVFQLLLDLGADICYMPKFPPAGYVTPLDAGAESKDDDVRALCQGILAARADRLIGDAVDDASDGSSPTGSAPARSRSSMSL